MVFDSVLLCAPSAKQDYGLCFYGKTLVTERSFLKLVPTTEGIWSGSQEQQAHLCYRFSVLLFVLLLGKICQKQFKKESVLVHHLSAKSLQMKGFNAKSLRQLAENVAYFCSASLLLGIQPWSFHFKQPNPPFMARGLSLSDSTVSCHAKQPVFTITDRKAKLSFALKES